MSAYLYQYTSNQTYNSAAELSVQFMRNQLYDGNYIGQTLSVNNCSRAMESFSFNSGFYIEALSVHASMNSTWTSLWVNIFGPLVQKTDSRLSEVFSRWSLLLCRTTLGLAVTESMWHVRSYLHLLVAIAHHDTTYSLVTG